MHKLTTEEHQRYARHLSLPEFDVEHQLKLKRGKVLIVGAGGLGSPLVMYLAAAGIGKIGVIDADTVALSNLQRQVLYSTKDIGQAKAELATKYTNNLNPNIEVIQYQEMLTNDNALTIFQEYDVIADGSDNFPTRYLVNDAAVLTHKPVAYASIYQFEGQVAVFNYSYPDGTKGPHYRDLFPTPPEPNLVPNCAQGGVLGVLAGIVGSLQALEVIKIITGIGEPLVAKMLIYEALNTSFRVIRYGEKSKVKVAKLINYEDFCGISPELNVKRKEMKEITAQELKEWKDQGKDFQLVDVREQHEVDLVNIGGKHIPLGDIMARSEEIDTDKEVVVMCRSGQRSGAAVMALAGNGFTNLINLKGGILGWARDVDTSLPTY